MLPRGHTGTRLARASLSQRIGKLAAAASYTEEERTLLCVLISFCIAHDPVVLEALAAVVLVVQQH